MSDEPRILVVDDELGPRESLRMILNDRYEVATADSGAAAVEYVSSNPTDVVLLDIRMPGMDGIETLSRIKQIRPEVEVVMVTAYASVNTAKDAVSYDAVDYLIKPFSREDVNKAVVKSLARREQRLGPRREIRSLVDQMRALTWASSQIGSEQGLLPMLSGIVEEGAQVLSADDYAVCSVSEQENWLVRVLCGRLSQKFMEEAAARCREVVGGKGFLPPKPVVVYASEEDDHQAVLRELMLKEEYRSAALLPLLYGREVLGALALCRRGERAYSQRELELAQAFANQAAVVLKTSQLYEDLQGKATELSQKVAQLSILREISAAVLSNLDLDTMLESVTQGLKRLGYEHAKVYKVSEAQKGPQGWDKSGDFAPAISLGVKCDPLEKGGGFRITSPIAIDGQPAYMLEVHAQRQVDEKELELMGMLSEHLAIAVRNSQLYKEISETKSYLESLIDNAGDAILAATREDIIVSWNSAAEQIFQYNRADALGKDMRCLMPEAEYDKQKAMMLARGQARSFETEGERKDGTTVDIDVILSPIRGSNNDIVGISAIVKDVTERNELQHQLVHSEKQRALGVMSSGVAHNFNNILSGVLGHAQLLQMRTPKGEDYQKIHDSLKVIEKAAMGGAAIIRRMQEFARVTEDKTPTPVDLNEVIRDSLSISKPKWKHEPEARGIKIDVRTELGDVPWIYGNKSHLGEVLLNLIFNAVEAMPDGGEISIRTWTEGSRVCLSVSDTGIGMSEETKERVFDPFFTTKGIKGVGLGMSVVHGIVKRHSGQIDVDSVEGKGTTFTVKFPIPEKVEKEVQEEVIPERVVPAKILFIEDMQDIRDFFYEIGETVGCQVSLASSGSEVLGILEKAETEFDVLFTDLSMPDMNGWQVAKRAREIDPKIPIILCTGWGVEADHKLVEEYGIDFVVSKPYQVNQILNVVRKAVELRRKRG